MIDYCFESLCLNIHAMIRHMIKIMLGSIPHQKLSFLSFTYSRTSRNSAWGCWYVSVVSIIFDCSMPILFKFHILLATFYIIFGTNILIQCPVSVPVCCMFLVSRNIHIKQSPNGIKTEGELFWNIYDFWEVKSTRDGARGGHETGAHAHSRWAPPCLVATLDTVSLESSSGKSQIFQNNSPSVFIPFGLRLVLVFCKT